MNWEKSLLSLSFLSYGKPRKREKLAGHNAISIAARLTRSSNFAALNGAADDEDGFPFFCDETDRKKFQIINSKSAERIFNSRKAFLGIQVNPFYNKVWYQAILISSNQETRTDL